MSSSPQGQGLVYPGGDLALVLVQVNLTFSPQVFPHSTCTLGAVGI